MAEATRKGAPAIPAKGTGTAEWRNGHWWVKVSLPDDTRPRYRLCLDGACTCAIMSDSTKEERCKSISERERRGGRLTNQVLALDASRLLGRPAVTWAMRAGKGDGWIRDRIGHLTPEMRGRYARAARVLADLKYEPFPSLDGWVPELWELPDNVRSIMNARRGAE